MRILLPILLLSACTSGPSKQDASRLFLATTAAVAADEQKAVTSTQALAPTPAVRNLDYIGPCDGEGSFEVRGTVDDTALTFDVQSTFTNCVSLSHVALDGSLHFTPTSLAGSISFSDQTTSAACDLDLQFAGTAVSGTVCGYDVKDLGH